MSFNRKHIRAAAMGQVIQAANKKDDAILGAAVRVIIKEMLETEKAAQEAEAKKVLDRSIINR